MPLAHHRDYVARFEQQYENAQACLVPFVEDALPPGDERAILDVGCGEGGVLKAFAERGWTGIGVDLGPQRIERAQHLLPEHIARGQLHFETADIHDWAAQQTHRHAFDVIVLKDVIEHIYDRPRMMAALQTFLKPGGVLFIGFPPWRMPYGGHQQIADAKLAQLPYYHLLPRPLYRGLLKGLGESEAKIENLMEVWDTRLSIQQAERLFRETGYAVLKRELYLINPIYAQKFGLTPRPQLPVLRDLPWLRDFFTTAVYYLLRPV